MRSWKDILIPATATNWTTALWWLPSLRSSSFAVYRLGAGGAEQAEGSRVIAPPNTRIFQKVRFASRRAAGCGFPCCSRTLFPGTKPLKYLPSHVPPCCASVYVRHWPMVCWFAGGSSRLGQTWIWLRLKLLVYFTYNCSFNGISMTILYDVAGPIINLLYIKYSHPKVFFKDTQCLYLFGLGYYHSHHYKTPLTYLHGKNVLLKLLYIFLLKALTGSLQSSNTFLNTVNLSDKKVTWSICTAALHKPCNELKAVKTGVKDLRRFK